MPTTVLIQQIRHSRIQMELIKKIHIFLSVSYLYIYVVIHLLKRKMAYEKHRYMDELSCHHLSIDVQICHKNSSII